MKVEGIMRSDYISFQADDMLEDVVKTLAKNHLAAAPVFDGPEFLGIVSDTTIVKFFMPKKFLFLWNKDKETSLDEIRKTTVGRLVKKPQFILAPDQELFNALPKIVTKVDCIPVLDKNKLVGIITSEELVAFFLKEFVKSVSTEIVESGDRIQKLDTEIDSIIRIVNSQGEVQASQLASELGISLKTVEKLAESLSHHHLIELKYSFFKGAILKRLDYEKK